MSQLIEQFPHCDQRILHKPGTCLYCDGHPLWQELRDAWGIAFTGETPIADQLPCPADHARPAGSEADHRQWGGNKPTSASGANWPPETPASIAFYGDRGSGMIERLGQHARRKSWLPWR